MKMNRDYLRHRQEIADMLDERFHTIDWLDMQIESGAYRVIGCDDAVIIVGFERYPTGWLELQGVVAAGRLESIRDILIPQAEELARAMGCGSAEIESREAWVKIMAPFGYELHQTKIKKVF